MLNPQIHNNKVKNRFQTKTVVLNAVSGQISFLVEKTRIGKEQAVRYSYVL